MEARAERDSNDAVAHYNVAIGYWSKNRYDDAERELREAATIDPQFAEAYLALAHLPYARRPSLWSEIVRDRVPAEWEPALDESNRNYRRAFVLNPLVDLKIAGAVVPTRSGGLGMLIPGWYEFWMHGFDDFLEGNYEGAYMRLSRIMEWYRVEGNPDEVPNSVLWHHGLSAAHVGNYGEAIADFQVLLTRSLQEERKDSLVYVPIETNEYRYILATLEYRAGNLVEAERLYQETLGYDIGLYMAHVGLSRIYEAQALWDDAITECRRAVQANPEESTLVLHLGVTLGKAGQLEEAEKTVDRAVRMNPRDVRAYYVQGLVAMELGNSEAARAAFVKFIAVAPSRFEEEATDARRYLEILR